MSMRTKGVTICIATFALSAAAQTVTGSGSSGTVPVFTGTSTVANSPISVSGGNVGIGTTNPGGILGIGGANIPMGMTTEVGGTTPLLNFDVNFRESNLNTAYPGAAIRIDTRGSDNPLFQFLTRPANGAEGTEIAALAITQANNVGIGTSSPGTGLFVSKYNLNDLGTNYNSTAAFNVNGSDVNLVIGGYGGNVNAAILQSLANGSPSLIGPNPYRLILNPLGGNVGIGTTTPGAKLEVDGSVILTSGSGASITFADGTIQSTAYTGVTCGGDYAESVDVAGLRTSYEPGDVLVIGPDSGSDVIKSSEPYSTAVTGVYSTKPGIVGRRQATELKTSKPEVPMAMLGIVPTKVSAENGPIKRGDLLVTSSIPGYAMKGTDRSRLTGAVIGKALGNLDSGMGLIEAVITLQ